MVRIIPYGRNMGRNNLSKMMDDFFDTSLEKLSNDNSFKLDIIEKEDKYVINAELPGIDKEDINIEVDDGILSISAEHVEESEKVDNDKYLYRERSQKSMSRKIYLGEVDEENISASLKDGILEIILPKAKEEDNTKRIEIE